MIRKAPPKSAPPETVCDPAAFLHRLEDLQGDLDVAFASETIEGIYATVTRTGRVTAGQRTAIDHIEEGGQRGRRRW
jgi:hypothetical protein